MGYYDYQPEDFNKRRSPVFLVFISAIIGGLITSFATPYLMNTGLFPKYYTYKPPTGPIQSTSIQVNTKITDAVEKVKGAVVGIINLQNTQDFFSQQEVEQGTGSGIIFERGNGKARVVTNYHVIKDANQVKVVIGEAQKTVKATVLGSDEITDLAVLEIPDQLVTTVAHFGNSDTLKAGEPAIAIGNPLGLGQSVTLGVISSPKRTIDVSETMSTDVIQTDASINPGNSGGALINAAGQIIGINRLKISQRGGMIVEGLGFAIPSNDALPIIQNLIQNGMVPRPFLGIQYVDLHRLPESVWGELLLPSNLSGGIVVRSIINGSPAQKAGLKPRDVIIGIDKQNITSTSDLRKNLYNKKVGDQVRITYYRNGKKLQTTLQLAKAPKKLS